MNNTEQFDLCTKLYLCDNEEFKDIARKLYVKLFNARHLDINIGTWVLEATDEKFDKKYFLSKLANRYVDNMEIQYKCNLFICANFLKYNFSGDNLYNAQENLSKLLTNVEFLKLGKVNTYYFHFYSKVNNLSNTKYLFESIQSIQSMEKRNNIGIYMLSINKSPCFKLYKEVYINLSEIDPNIIFFIDSDESELEIHKENMKNMKYICVKDLTDDELIRKIKEYKIDVLLANYIHYNRQKLLSNKFCRILVNGFDGGFIFDKSIFDYCFMFETDLNIENTNLIVLKNFFPFPFLNKNIISNSNYDKIFKIGLITTNIKFSRDLIKLLSKLLSNQNIIITIYGFFSDYEKTRLNDLLDYYGENLKFSTYNNLIELSNNHLYIDTFIYNNHSTCNEIISTYRPIVSFYNKDYYCAQYTKSVISVLDMENELCRDNLDDYYNLVMSYANSRDNYERMYKKFCENLDKSTILDTKEYANSIYRELKKLVDN